jgi:hypothetical protein
MFHGLVFFLSAVILLLWLIAAGWLSGYFAYYLGALLVLGILVISLRSD